VTGSSNYSNIVLYIEYVLLAISLDYPAN